MEILMIFETVEGQTRRIVEAVGKQLRAKGHGVRQCDTSERLVALSFEGIDKVILAAPVHERRHPKGFEVLVGASREQLRLLPSLIISVSLKAAFSDGLEEAQDYLTEMEMRTRFTPDQRILAAGAVREASYGYFESQIIKNVVLNGRSVDLIDGVHEFTDWEKLHADVDAFLEGTSLKTT